LIERRRHSSGERSLRGTACGIDGYAVIKKLLKYCLNINEKFDVDSFDLKRPLIWKLRNSIRFISVDGLQL